MFLFTKSRRHQRGKEKNISGCINDLKSAKPSTQYPIEESTEGFQCARQVYQKYRHDLLAKQYIENEDFRKTMALPYHPVLEKVVGELIQEIQSR